MPTLLRERRPTARKPHYCEDCAGVIAAGTRYHRDTLVYDGHVYDWITCGACAELVNVVWKWADPYHDEGIGRDEFLDWAEAHVEDAEYGEAAQAFLSRGAA